MEPKTESFIFIVTKQVVVIKQIPVGLTAGASLHGSAASNQN